MGRHRPGPNAMARLVVAIVVVTAMTMTAAPADAALGRNYAAWTVAGAAGSFTGTADVGVAGFPGVAFRSDHRSLGTASSATLTAATPFGAAFGTSSGRQYLSIGTTTGNTAPASTTFTFESPTPTSGWGFALGDIDAESIRVTATGTDGSPVATSALGFEGGFNYSPGGTDQPTWDPATSTLIGNPCPGSPAPPDCDTNGAAGWFRPTVPLSTLSLEFTVQGGAPLYQLWFAANSVVVTGTIELTPPPGMPPPEVEVQIAEPGGAPIGSVTTEGGAFELPPVVAGPEYEVTVVPPAGWRLEGPSTFLVDTSTGDPTPITARVVPSEPTPTTTTTVTPPRASPAPLRFAG